MYLVMISWTSGARLCKLIGDILAEVLMIQRNLGKPRLLVDGGCQVLKLLEL